MRNSQRYTLIVDKKTAYTTYDDLRSMVAEAEATGGTIVTERWNDKTESWERVA